MAALSSLMAFGWGCGGGAVVALGQAFFHIQNAPDSIQWTQKRILTLLLWIVYIPFAGFAAVLCEPHIAFVAAYEGAALPSMFFFVGHHMPGGHQPAKPEAGH